MFDKKLIKKMRKWLRDYEKTSDPMDIDPDTYEGSAYNLLACAVSEATELNDATEGREI